VKLFVSGKNGFARGKFPHPHPHALLVIIELGSFQVPADSSRFRPSVFFFGKERFHTLEETERSAFVPAPFHLSLVAATSRRAVTHCSTSSQALLRRRAPTGYTHPRSSLPTVRNLSPLNPNVSYLCSDLNQLQVYTCIIPTTFDSFANAIGIPTHPYPILGLPLGKAEGCVLVWGLGADVFGGLLYVIRSFQCRMVLFACEMSCSKICVA
jgi:hypothetical protein